jgi:hypothetical protein
MKNKRLLSFYVIIIVFAPCFVNAQAISAKAFYNTDSVSTTYLGIDFTLTKLINDNGASAIKNAIGHVESKNFKQWQAAAK